MYGRRVRCHGLALKRLSFHPDDPARDVPLLISGYVLGRGLEAVIAVNLGRVGLREATLTPAHMYVSVGSFYIPSNGRLGL